MPKKLSYSPLNKRFSSFSSIKFIWSLDSSRPSLGALLHSCPSRNAP
jgi:hypothetical protein